MALRYSIAIVGLLWTASDCRLNAQTILSEEREHITFDTIFHPDGTYTAFIVNDMEILEDKCYFCGVKTHSHTGGLPLDSLGFVGKCKIPVGGFGPIVEYEIQTVPYTKCLNRMTVCGGGTNVMIAMIGIHDTAVRQDCLAMVKNITPAWNWLYDLRINSDTNERFTDIDCNSKDLVIVSRRMNVTPNDTEEEYLYVRRANLQDVMDYHNCSDLNYRHRFHLTTASLSSNGYTLKHKEDADIRMCAVPWNTSVHIAYECIGKVWNCHYATALCRVETSGVSMDNLQIVEEDFIKPGTLVDMKYIYDASGDERGNAVGLLHLADTGTYTSVLESPFGLVNDYGTIYQCLVQNSKERRFSSLNIYNGNGIRLAGREKPGNNNIVHLKQRRQTVNDKGWCLNNDKKPVKVCEDVLYPESPVVILRKKTQTPQKFLWGETHTPEPDQVSANKICSKETQQ